MELNLDPKVDQTVAVEKIYIIIDVDFTCSPSDRLEVAPFPLVFEFFVLLIIVVFITDGCHLKSRKRFFV